MSTINIVAKPGVPSLTITRELAAPLDIVFRAYTEPELIAKWWGPRDMEMTIDTMDARPGGSWRFLHRDPQGNQYGFHGVYHSMDAPNQIVQTSEFEGLPQRHVSLETVTFTEQDGVTTATVVVAYQAVEDRDAHIASGMERGLSESMDRLDELLESEQVESESTTSERVNS